MTRKQKVAELERNVERVFLEFSIVVLIVVLLAMMIGARRVRWSNARPAQAVTHRSPQALTLE